MYSPIDNLRQYDIKKDLLYERNEKRIRFKVTFVFLKIQVVNRNQRYILENKKKKKKKEYNGSVYKTYK